MKVLFISANTEKINILPIPLGLLYVAAAVKKSGHDIRILDLMAHADSRVPIREALASFSPDVIGISIRNIDDQCMHGARFLLDDVKAAVQYCRSLTEAVIVLGGAGYSIFPEAVLSYLEADMGIQGEGEAAFPELVKRLEKRSGLADLPGLYLKKKGLQGERLFVERLDDLPVDGADHFLSDYGKDLWMPFQTRRGCPMNCSYCSTSAIEGSVLRKRSPERAIDELKRFVAAGFRQFYFVDNTFNLPPAYAKKLCRLIIQAGLDIRWRCIFYPGRVDESLIERMAEAGCVEVSLGFESGSKAILKSMNKRFQPEEVRRTSLLLEKHHIGQMGFLMLGGPGETQATVLESLAFADSLPLDAVKVSQGIRIYPHTDLAKIAVNDGIIDSSDNLLLPAFYMVREIEAWLKETVSACMAERPNWMG